MTILKLIGKVVQMLLENFRYRKLSKLRFFYEAIGFISEKWKCYRITTIKLGNFEGLLQEEQFED